MKGDAVKAGKFSKERITVLLGVNATGTEKMKPLVIGKSENLRCFTKGMKKPLMYRWNKKAWMTGALFEEYVTDLDKKMTLAGRKIILFLDNCSSHDPRLRLNNVTLIFSPPNTTSVLRPADQGIIKCFKGYYRQKLIRYLINSITAEPEKHVKDFKVNLKQAMEWSKAAWESVTEETIRNCFAKSGFITKRTHIEPSDPFVEADQMLSELAEKTGEEMGSMDEFVTVDDHIVPTDSPSFQPEQHDNSDTEISNGEEGKEETVRPNHKDVMAAINMLSTYSPYASDGCNLSQELDKIEEKVMRESLKLKKQSSILSYFKLQ